MLLPISIAIWSLGKPLYPYNVITFYPTLLHIQIQTDLSLFFLSLLHNPIKIQKHQSTFLLLLIGHHIKYLLWTLFSLAPGFKRVHVLIRLIPTRLASEDIKSVALRLQIIPLNPPRPLPSPSGIPVQRQPHLLILRRYIILPVGLGSPPVRWGSHLTGLPNVLFDGCHWFNLSIASRCFCQQQGKTKITMSYSSLSLFFPLSQCRSLLLKVVCADLCHGVILLFLISPWNDCPLSFDC